MFFSEKLLYVPSFAKQYLHFKLHTSAELKTNVTILVLFKLFFISNSSFFIIVSLSSSQFSSIHCSTSLISFSPFVFVIVTIPFFVTIKHDFSVTKNL